MTISKTILKSAISILFLTAALSGCGGEGSAQAAAPTGANNAAAPVTAPAPAAVPARTRLLGQWTVSVQRSLEHMAPGWRALIEQNPGAFHAAYTFTADSVTQQTNDQPASTNPYTIVSEAANSMVISVTGSNGTPSQSDITFQDDGSVLLFARDLRSGFILTRDGAAAAH